MRQRIALLGSTGSIGEQTLDIARAYPEKFEILTLTAHSNWQKLAAQAREFLPDSIVITDKAYYTQLKEAVADLTIKVYAGSDATAQVAAGGSIDVVVNAIVGFAGLAPTVAAIKAGKKLALANKESLVVAGDIVMKLSADNKAPIIPVDSEHSAIFQCLCGEYSPVKKLILTASGGPFRHLSATQLEHVTVGQALAHPNWDMGAKITIDSATMMNKGLEVIEARWLFGIGAEQIEVIIHPQSIVHSLVEFEDGALKAQLGLPDMRLPIQYALTFPHRWKVADNSFSFTDYPEFTFFKPDTDTFPALRLAYNALACGGNHCCVLNAANEIAVGAFLEGRIKFTSIPAVIEQTLSSLGNGAGCTLDDYTHYDKTARQNALAIIANLT